VPRDFKESRLYRTGGIIESVVNVQGVHKTIIENVSDDENEENFALLSSYRSLHGSKY
jgi:metal transporter CNNM